MHVIISNLCRSAEFIISCIIIDSKQACNYLSCSLKVKLDLKQQCKWNGVNMKKQSGICNSGNYEVLIKGDTTENINYFVTTEFL